MKFAYSIDDKGLTHAHILIDSWVGMIGVSIVKSFGIYPKISENHADSVEMLRSLRGPRCQFPPIRTCDPINCPSEIADAMTLDVMSENDAWIKFW